MTGVLVKRVDLDTAPVEATGFVELCHGSPGKAMQYIGPGKGFSRKCHSRKQADKLGAQGVDER